MPSGVVEILQYGALGLLTAVLVGCGWAAKWMLERLAQTFDKQTEALDKINAVLTAMNVAQVTHAIEMRTAFQGAVTSDDLTAVAKEILQEIRSRAA